LLNKSTAEVRLFVPSHYHSGTTTTSEPPNLSPQVKIDGNYKYENYN
jgi:hypothetical protein